MKTKPRSRIPLHMMLLAGMLPGLAVADEPASAGNPESVTPATISQPGEPEPAPKRETTFLGVETAQADAATRKRLKLSEGTGLRVRFVAPKSPAAGKLQAGDVLTHFDDQVLCNHDQLRALVRGKNPGDTVRLKLFRDGESMNADVKLGKAQTIPQENAGGEPAFVFRPDFNIRINGKDISLGELLSEKMAEIKNGIITVDPEQFKDLPEDVRAMLKDLHKDFEKRTGEFGERREKHKNAKTEKPQPEAATPPETTQKITVEIMPENEKDAPVSDDNPVLPETKSRNITKRHSFSFGDGLTSSVIINDDQGTVMSTKRGDSRRITIKDPAGKTIFDGPTDTEAQRNAMPDDAKRRLELIDSLAGEK